VGNFTLLPPAQFLCSDKVAAFLAALQNSPQKVINEMGSFFWAKNAEMVSGGWY